MNIADEIAKLEQLNRNGSISDAEFASAKAKLLAGGAAGGQSAEVRAAGGNRIAAGICAILLGYLGVHKFILGLTTPGIIMLLVTVLTCGAGSAVTGVIGLIEGIIYLTKSDEEFYQTYVVEKKAWF